ncbi:hypothetical protein KFU94_36280 [Chloroflexi bacterium TSY]|nr:hypothetical protein [Chloroflexi bacterium TSY]
MNQENKLSQNTVEKQVRKALRDWHKEGTVNSPFRDLYLFRQKQLDGYSNNRLATNQVLIDLLEELESTHEHYARLLRTRYLDCQPVSEVAVSHNVIEDTIFRWQRAAIRHLSELLIENEYMMRKDQQHLLETRLPPPTYTELIGIDTYLDRLLELVSSTDSPHLISIEGIGGIGKTSLAHALMRRIICQGRYDSIGWVSARQTSLDLVGRLRKTETTALTGEALITTLVAQLMPDVPLPIESALDRAWDMLQTELREHPHLIVIDNLETVVDVESLLPTLMRLTNPTKFILTSRDSLYSEPNVYHFAIRELSESDSFTLIRQEAKLSNLPIVAESADGELQPIVEVVGGNPLALRLVVGQMHLHPLTVILADLREARGESIENLYTFVYWRAWHNLDELSQRVFLAMPMVNPSHGDNISHLKTITELDADSLRLALSKLVTLNLVDSSGDLHKRRYNIHSLTRTFLQNQVAQWQ